MDMLQEIFHLQERFNQQLRVDRELQATGPEWIQKEALALMVELGEVLEEARFKWWKNNQPVDETKLQEELVDVLHFFVSMCLDAGMDAEGLYQGYVKKNQENFRRQQGLSDRSGYELEKRL